MTADIATLTTSEPVVEWAIPKVGLQTELTESEKMRLAGHADGPCREEFEIRELKSFRGSRSRQTSVFDVGSLPANGVPRAFSPAIRIEASIFYCRRIGVGKLVEDEMRWK